METKAKVSVRVTYEWTRLRLMLNCAFQFKYSKKGFLEWEVGGNREGLVAMGWRVRILVWMGGKEIVILPFIRNILQIVIDIPPISFLTKKWCILYI